MKKYILLFIALFAFLSISLQAQTEIDVINLKNGDILKGQILKDVPGNYIQLELKDGIVKKISYAEIEKRGIEKLPLDTNIHAPSRKDLYGIKGGWNSSTFFHEHNNKPGWILGGFVNSPISEYLSLQVEVNYAQFNAISNVDELWNKYGIEYTFKQEYLTIPLLLMIELPVSKSTKFNLYPGLGIAVNLTSATILKVNGREPYDYQFHGISDVIPFAAAGLSFDTKMTEKMEIILDFRGNVGPTNLNSNSAQIDEVSWNFTFGLVF
jgi:hypothetical protein